MALPHSSPDVLESFLSQAEQELLKKIVNSEEQSQSERYLRDHSKELNSLIAFLVHQVLDKKPDNISAFISEICARPDLRDLVMGSNSETKKQNKPLGIIIAGAPASGKGTQCELIINQCGVIHISTGDLLRAAVAKNTELGQKAKKYMDSGRLVPDEMVIELVIDRLNATDVQERGWLLDGFPRTIAQAEALKRVGIVPDKFILLDVSDEIVIDRMSGRRIDPVTSKVYHVRHNPPPPEIEGRLIQRSDDTVSKIRARLDDYRRNIEQICKFYDQDLIFRVNGALQKEQVFSQIGECLS